MKSAPGYFRPTDNHPVIGRGSGMTLRELSRALNTYLRQRGDLRSKEDERHIWRRGRANRGTKSGGHGLKVPKAFRDIWDLL